ncbi:MAG: acyl-CoA dehydrogenase [Bacteroidota bacterium]
METTLKELSKEELKSLPGVLDFLPILFVAWADAVLQPSELEAIEKQIAKQKWVTDKEKAVLKQWLDPQNPPSPRLMKTWLSLIREGLQKIPEDMRSSLSQVGVQLSQLGSESLERCSSPEACMALDEIERELNIISSESFNQIAGKEKKEEKASSATFESSQMQSLLDGEDAETIKIVKQVLLDPKFDYPEPMLKEDFREKVLEWSKLLAQQGFGAAAYPKKYGGQGDMQAYFSIMETLSYHDLSLVIKFGVQFGLFGMSIYFLGTEKHHKKYLPKAGTLELPGCFAMTETGHGSNVRDIETTATYDKSTKEFIIHTPHYGARKDYIGNAAKHGQMATVFAQLIVEEVEYGVSALLVPIRDKQGNTLPAITIEDCGEKMGLNGVDNGRLIFNQVRVPLENLLDNFAQVSEDGVYSSPISGDDKRFFTMLSTLVGGRIGIPRSALSATKSALAIATKYAAKRRQFGPPGEKEVFILNYKSHQKRLIPLIANAYAVHFGLQYLTKRYIHKNEEDAREIEALAAGLKAYATWNASDTIQECREACGGQGYLAENRFAALKNDTEIFMTFEGDNTVLMQLVAKGRLTEFKQEFHNINFFGILRFVSEQATTAFSARNPIITRRADREHLLDHDFHMDIFSYRERDILVSAAKRFKKYLSEGMSSFEAFNECQLHMLQVGFAYVERVVLEQFILQINQTSDHDLKGILSQLCSVYALSTIEKYKGWYLEHNYMEGVKTKAIRKLINELNKDLKKNAVALVDSFGIPDKLLNAPIAIS